VVEFAATKARKKPNCTPGKSQWCPGKTGTGACVSLKKQCRVKPAGGLGEAADFVTKPVKEKKAKPAAEAKTKTPRTSKSKPKEQAAADDLRGQLSDLRQKAEGYTLADEKRMASLALKHYENPDDNVLLSKVLVAQNKFHEAKQRFQRAANPIVESYIERASTDVASSVKEHSMPKPEMLKSFEFEGIRYHYNEQDSNSLNAVRQLVRDVGSRDPLPAALTAKTGNVYVSSQEHGAVNYWRDRYNNPKMEIGATGGSGDVVFYNGGSGVSNLRSALAHEMGHNFATSKYGGTTPPPTSEFARASAQHPAPSDYAKNGLNEDFAESVKYYATDPGYLRTNAPARYDVIKRLMEDPDYAG
jgi:hypothetical protein